MTPAEIIDEIWKLSWSEVLQVAIADDWIFFTKIAPIFVPIMGIFLAMYVFWYKREERKDKE